MAQSYGFFDAEQLSTGEMDRVYNADSFARYFASFIGNGVFGGKLSELNVIAKDASQQMKVYVQPGQAWINGYWYESTSEVEMSIDYGDTSLSRIDSVVLQLDFLLRTITLIVKKGTPASVPEQPVLTRDNSIYELRLCNINIPANKAYIIQTDIYDTRFNTADCGFVIGVINQIDTTNYGAQLQNFINEYIAKANQQYNNVFLPGLAGIQALAQQAYDDFIVWLNGIKASITTQSQEMFTEMQSIIDYFNQMIIDDPFTELVARVEKLEALLPTNNFGQIIHELNEYPAVFAYEYTNGPGVSIDSDGVVTGATLTSTDSSWSMSSNVALILSGQAKYGTVASITKINERTYNILFSDTSWGIYVKLGGGGGDSGSGGGGDNITQVKRSMFEVYYSQSQLTTDNPGCIKGWTGELVQGADATYPDFYVALKTNHPELITTNADYNARIAATGGCSLYVIDTDPTTGLALPGAIRFPTISNYIRGPKEVSGSAETVSNEYGDAIRNMSGQFTFGNAFNSARGGTAPMSPPFTIKPTISQNLYAPTPETNASGFDVGFDASLAVPTADENRPKTQILYPWIVVANAVVETGRQVIVIDEAQIQDEITNLTNSVDALTIQVNTLDGTVINNTAQINVNTGNISSLTSRVVTLEGKVTTLNTQYETLDSRITANTGAISSEATKLVNLTTRVSTLESNYFTLTGSVTANTNSIYTINNTSLPNKINNPTNPTTAGYVYWNGDGTTKTDTPSGGGGSGGFYAPDYENMETQNRLTLSGITWTPQKTGWVFVRISGTSSAIGPTNIVFNPYYGAKEYNYGPGIQYASATGQLRTFALLLPVAKGKGVTFSYATSGLASVTATAYFIPPLEADMT